MQYHQPVLIKESIDGLHIRPDGVYVDLTFGGGGHSREILKRLKRGRLLAFDQDEDANKNIIDDKRFLLINNNYRYLKNFIRYYEIEEVDGIIADLGVSSHQFDSTERGFSYRYSGNLDMRMNKRMILTAQDILLKYNQDNLRRVFNQYGEIGNSNQLSKAIIDYRNVNSIDSTANFIEAIKKCLPLKKQNQYLSKVFQALRIEVNDEINALKDVLSQVADFISKKGRLVVISYHSLEDRLVKNFIKAGNFEGVLRKDFYGNIEAPFIPVNKNVITPSREEIAVNPRARSAKLRIAERT